MKRHISFLLVFVLLLASLVSCNTIPPEGSGEQNQPSVTPPVGDVIPEYDSTVIVKPNEGENQPTTPPESGEQPTTPPDSGDVVTGEFVTKYKTYTFEGNNVAIIKLQNHSSQNYTVTINAKYLDAAGNELKAETQTFEGFPAGWENHLVFKPDIQFAKFTYTVSLNVFNGECTLSAESKIYFSRVLEMKAVIDALGMAGDHTRYPTISAEYIFENMKDIYAQLYFIVFDNKGDIYRIKFHKGAEGSHYSTQDGIYLVQTTEKTIVWPDELTGDVTGIVAIQSATAN